jgi:parvulin-like peptidyl-prolyl isomerase
VALPALLALLPIIAPAPAAAAETLNRIVLRVNDQIATLYDYQQRRADAMREVMRRVHDPKEQQEELAQVSENVFRDMFQELLLSSRADQLAVEISDQEVDQAIANLKQNFGIKTDEEFQQALEQSGMTVEMMRAQTRRNLRMRDVMGKEVQARVKLKDEDLRRYYRTHDAEFRVPEQVQLHEVVVLEESGLPPAERARVAAEIHDAIAAGKSLTDAAAPFVAKGQASKEADLGWVSPHDLDAKLEAAAWKLAKNGVTEPVDARGGLHVIQLLDRHPAHVRPFAEVQAQIQGKEQERLYRVESARFMAELESKSLVVADPPREAANFRRKIGAQEDPSMQGLAAGGTASGSPAAAGATPAAGDAAAAAALASEVRPAPVDASDQKKGRGGLPTAKPAGAPSTDKVTIPPPSPAAPPPPPGR